jgi:SNF2 family DNA or RNA helicase
MKGKLNNLMIQLRKNCNHPDLLEAAYDGSCIFFVILCVFISNGCHIIHLKFNISPIFVYRFLPTS